MPTNTTLLLNRQEFKNLFPDLAPSTFNYRLSQLGIEPDTLGFYHGSDVEIMKALSVFLANGGGTIKRFKKVYYAN